MGDVAIEIAGEIADEVLALLPASQILDDPRREIDAEPLEHAVIVLRVRVIDGADEFDIAAVDATAVPRQNLVDPLPVDERPQLGVEPGHAAPPGQRTGSSRTSITVTEASSMRPCGSADDPRLQAATAASTSGHQDDSTPS